MRNFLINCFNFFLMLIGCNVLLWFAAKNLYYKNYHEYSLDYRSYLLADSHGSFLKNLTEKYGVYNFSGNSDSYFDMKRKAIFLVNNTNLNKLYITVDDHTLSLYREKSNSADRSNYFVIPEGCRTNYEYLKYRYLKCDIVFFQPTTRTILKSLLFQKQRQYS